MTACTFLGHRDCPEDMEPKLREALIDLIVHHGVEMFYVGHQGRFDAMARQILGELQREHPIRYAVVLAYLPGKQTEYDDFADTMVPEGIEAVHPRYAISWRNNWMLQRSDYVVTYITHTWGGAAQLAQPARKQGKTLICLD